jgi:hypothetical protein
MNVPDEKTPKALGMDKIRIRRCMEGIARKMAKNVNVVAP